MLITRKLVPEIYYNQSRDFQVLGRVFDIVFNYIKTNIDLLSGSPYSQNMSDSLVDLLTKTLGFETKHQYNTQDLIAICGVFSDLLRNKGTKSAIKNAVITLMNIQNVSGYVDVVSDEDDDGNKLLKIFIPEDLQDLVLIEDLFTYILPAGYDYRFIRVTEGGSDNKSSLCMSQDKAVFISSKDTTTLNKIASVGDGPDYSNDTWKKPFYREYGEEEDTDDFSLTFTSVVASPNAIPVEQSEDESEED